MMLDRRHFLAGLGAVAALAAAPAWAQAAAGPRRPNIVYVYPDELRLQSLGYFGLEPVKTPRIDQFAAQSLD